MFSFDDDSQIKVLRYILFINYTHTIQFRFAFPWSGIRAYKCRKSNSILNIEDLYIFQILITFYTSPILHILNLNFIFTLVTDFHQIFPKYSAHVKLKLQWFSYSCSCCTCLPKIYLNHMFTIKMNQLGLV